VLAGAFAVFGAAALLHGSGYLAAYLYGLTLAARRDLPQRESVEHLHSQLAGIGEIALCVILGTELARVGLRASWGDAALLALVVTALIRPVAAYPPLRAFRFTRAEAAFSCWGGLKGAVPILLALTAYSSGVAQGPQIFALAGLVVLLSLLVQGATLGRVAARLGL
jgi:cell volume regulation protein A